MRKGGSHSDVREKLEPAMGFEPATACLQNRCSTVELRRRVACDYQDDWEKTLGKRPLQPAFSPLSEQRVVAPRGLEPRTY